MLQPQALPIKSLLAKGRVTPIIVTPQLFAYFLTFLLSRPLFLKIYCGDSHPLTLSVGVWCVLFFVFLCWVVGSGSGPVMTCKVIHMTAPPQVLATLTPEANAMSFRPRAIEDSMQFRAKLLKLKGGEQDGKEKPVQPEVEVVVSCTQRSSTRDSKLEEYRAALRKEEAECKAAVKALGEEVLALAERISSFAGGARPFCNWWCVVYCR
jgi:hypothetical protein